MFFSVSPCLSGSKNVQPIPDQYIYLDKGFCVEPVIEFLKGKPYEVIIACPIRGQKGGTRALCHGQKSCFTAHTFYAGKPKAYTAPITVVRTYAKRHGKRRAGWLLYVTLNSSTRTRK